MLKVKVIYGLNCPEKLPIWTHQLDRVSGIGQQYCIASVDSRVPARGRVNLHAVFCFVTVSVRCHRVRPGQQVAWSNRPSDWHWSLRVLHYKVRRRGLATISSCKQFVICHSVDSLHWYLCDPDLHALVVTLFWWKSICYSCTSCLRYILRRTFISNNSM
jgi:hypothetical protein